MRIKTLTNSCIIFPGIILLDKLLQLYKAHDNIPRSLPDLLKIQECYSMEGMKLNEEVTLSLGCMAHKWLCLLQFKNGKNSIRKQYKKTNIVSNYRHCQYLIQFVHICSKFVDFLYALMTCGINKYSGL